MKASLNPGRSQFLCGHGKLLLVAAIAMLSLVGRAEAQFSVVRVEEDWRMVLGTPDDDGDSPQVTTAISPAGDADADYCSFEMNHQSQPSYYRGGLHLHAWDGEYLLGSAHTQSGVSLHHDDEIISWTQALSITDGQLVYEVVQGTSDTWGSFGGDALRLTMGTTHSNLNGYDPCSSMRNSGVGYGANRVTSLRLVRVRLITSSGDTFELDIDQDVLQYSE